MSDIVPKDAESRSKISSDLNKSFFVEAGAGSGKTRSLVERMTALVSSGEAKVGNIAAITFTRKAAAELKEKFQIHLERKLSLSETPPEEKERARTALLDFDKAFLGTIHSFCGKLLRERSVEAGVDPAFKEIEEEDNFLHAETCWNAYLEKSALINPQKMEWMMSRGVDPSNLKGTFIRRAEYSDVESILKDVPAPDLSGYKKEVRAFTESMIKVLPEKEPEAGWDNVQSMVDRARRLIGMGYLKEDRKFIHLLTTLSKSPEVTIKKWQGLSSEQVKAIKEDFGIFQERVISPALKAWGEYLHKPVMEFIENGVEEYRKWREERSLLNFQDLLTFTASMLRTSSEVRNYFKSTITRLLVDEFQDTDPVQAEIIMLLTGSDNSQNNWRRLTPSPGALFVVGDPKQSIYRFRRADIDTYNMVKDLFKKGGCEVLSLEANFRSLPAIGDLCNKVFSEIFPQSGTKYQAAFAPLLTMRQQNKTSGIFTSPVEKVDRNSPHLAAEIDADRIASWIKGALEGEIKLDRTKSEELDGYTEKPTASDFMILTRGKARLHMYAEALEKLGIPYDVSGGESFCKSEELKELARLFRCLADPTDPVALVAVLRGKFFGVSDRELYLFKKQGGKFSFLDAPEVFQGSIAASYVKLKDLRELIIEHSPAVAAEKIMEEIGILPLACSGEMGSTKAGNIVKAMELLRASAMSEGMSFMDIAERLEAFLDSRGKEEMGLFPAESNAVRVMNLHKAKGLEANVVFLADPLGAWDEYEPDTHIVRTGEGSSGYFAVSRPKSQFSNDMDIFAFPSGWADMSEEEKKYARAEDVRLEYVALTRARNILCVSVYTDKSGSKQPAWAYIEPEVSNFPCIEPGNIKGIKKEKFDITKEQWEREMARVKNLISSLGERSFEVTSVTRTAKGNMVFEAASSGMGRSWGNIVHKALEACGKGMRESLPELAASWMIEEDMDPSKTAELIGLVDGIMKSDMWRRITEAREKYFEIPFSITQENTVFSGAMDLVFKENGEWVIVDYKTDDFESDPKRKAAYDRQLDMYASFWEKLTGEKVKEKVLYRV